ncbi:hypothetical protein [Nocardiopsis salina]|uniref:hypothetical protein n=1 Tax=Nocardiopsis salina TaxID=245836 RepID=UPI00034BC407|nr:hypothetical protein [Nocardiopsis salina]
MDAMPESRGCRHLRAGVFTLVCASLSAHGHALSSGHDIPLLGLLLGMAAVHTVAWASSTRSMGRLRIAGHMLWGQFALHMALSVTASSGGGHAAHGQSLDTAQGASAGTMIAMHVVSALVGAWWLHRGERAFFAFWGFMALRALPLLVVAGVLPAPATPPKARSPFPDQRGRPAFSYLRYTQVLRGPPVPSSA